MAVPLFSINATAQEDGLMLEYSFDHSVQAQASVDFPSKIH
jgi:hypothetical protein